MYYLVEETKDATNFYAVEVRKWCLCLMIFYLTELFEITMIPYCYRKWFSKKRKPTLLEWLGRHPRWWSRKVQYPAGTKIHVTQRGCSSYGFLNMVDPE